jgi:hypothetical protein
MILIVDISAAKFPYDLKRSKDHSISHNNEHPKSWLQQSIEEELGAGVPYLITGPGILEQRDNTRFVGLMQVEALAQQREYQKRFPLITSLISGIDWIWTPLDSMSSILFIPTMWKKRSLQKVI